jgi:anti-sigma28 factor (negative regulator of flagellin synthesis)
MAGSGLPELRVALGYETLKEFAEDWKALPDKDKAELKSAIENGTYTY